MSGSDECAQCGRLLDAHDTCFACDTDVRTPSPTNRREYVLPDVSLELNPGNPGAVSMVVRGTLCSVEGDTRIAIDGFEAILSLALEPGEARTLAAALLSAADRMTEETQVILAALDAEGVPA